MTDRADDPPGPPPDPPPDLARRRLSLREIPAGTRLHRIHHREREPLFFGPPPGSPPRGRWDAPDGAYRVGYFAERPEAAFAEVALRHPGLAVVQTQDLARLALSEVEVIRPLRLVALHGAGLARIGATGAVAMGPYAVCRAWSAALRLHPATIDGIRYRARHDDDRFALALFDRAADALAARGSVPLLARELTVTLAGWLDRYGIALIDP